MATKLGQYNIENVCPTCSTPNGLEVFSVESIQISEKSLLRVDCVCGVCGQGCATNVKPPNEQKGDIRGD